MQRWIQWRIYLTITFVRSELAEFEGDRAMLFALCLAQFWDLFFPCWLGVCCESQFGWRRFIDFAVCEFYFLSFLQLTSWAGLPLVALLTGCVCWLVWFLVFRLDEDCNPGGLRSSAPALSLCWECFWGSIFSLATGLQAVQRVEQKYNKKRKDKKILQKHDIKFSGNWRCMIFFSQ